MPLMGAVIAIKDQVVSRGCRLQVLGIALDELLHEETAGLITSHQETSFAENRRVRVLRSWRRARTAVPAQYVVPSRRNVLPAELACPLGAVARQFRSSFPVLQQLDRRID